MTAYQRAQLKQIIRQRADVENTGFETDLEIEQHINDGAAVLHDLLIAAAGENYSLAKGTFSTVAGTREYTISQTSFYRPRRISVVLDDMEYPLGTFERGDAVMRVTNESWGPGYLPRYSMQFDSSSVWTIEFDPPPDKAVTIKMAYHTLPPVYTTDQESVAIPYADYIIVEAAMRMKNKEERDATHLMQERAWIQKRIEDWGATFDMANPHRTLEAPDRYARATWRRDRVF